MSLRTSLRSVQTCSPSFLRPRLSLHLHGTASRRSNTQDPGSSQVRDDTTKPGTIPQIHQQGPSASSGGAERSKAVQDGWQNWMENSTSAARGRAISVSSAAFAYLGRMGRKLNHITGYEEIEALKRQVVEKGA